MGMALMSTLDVDTAGRSVPDTEGLRSSFLIGGALTAASFAVDRCGMFLMSLYRDCLQGESVSITERARRQRKASETPTMEGQLLCHLSSL